MPQLNRLKDGLFKLASAFQRGGQNFVKLQMEIITFGNEEEKQDEK